jgi:hypothetical protein
MGSQELSRDFSTPRHATPALRSPPQHWEEDSALVQKLFWSLVRAAGTNLTPPSGPGHQRLPVPMDVHAFHVSRPLHSVFGFFHLATCFQSSSVLGLGQYFIFMAA